MTKDELLKHISEGESVTLELKSNLIHTLNLKKIINAMVNTKGGLIIIGVNETGFINGLDLTQDHSIKVLKNGLLSIKGINSQRDPYCKLVKIEKSLIDGKTIITIRVNTSKWLSPVKNTDGNFYIRINDRTAIKTRELNKFKSIEETTIIKETKVPSEPMRPGDEKVVYQALKINPHKNIVDIKYKFDSEGINILAPYQDIPNTIRLEPNNQDSTFHLKYCVNKSINSNCRKQLYITVEEIFTKKWPYRVSRIIFYLLLALSFVPILKSFMNKSNWISVKILDLITFPLPLITILSFILLSNRVDRILKRLSLIKIESFNKYQEKHIGDEINIEVNHSNNFNNRIE